MELNNKIEMRNLAERCRNENFKIESFSAGNFLILSCCLSSSVLILFFGPSMASALSTFTFTFCFVLFVSFIFESVIISLVSHRPWKFLVPVVYFVEHLRHFVTQDLVLVVLILDVIEKQILDVHWVNRW